MTGPAPSRDRRRDRAARRDRRRSASQTPELRAVADALLEGGVRALEVTMTVPCASR
jgi:hypothetical protein